MAGRTIVGDPHRYNGGADKSADQIAYGFRFEVDPGPSKVNVEVLEGAPHTTARDARIALEDHLDAKELPPRILRGSDGRFYPEP